MLHWWRIPFLENNYSDSCYLSGARLVRYASFLEMGFSGSAD